MDRIHYAGDSFLTGTDIAHALLEYARALAQVGSSDTVEIPTLTEDGEPGRSEILVGPASQVISSLEELELEEVVDRELVARLQEMTANLERFGTSSPGASIQGEHEQPVGWSDFEDI